MITIELTDMEAMKLRRLLEMMEIHCRQNAKMDNRSGDRVRASADESDADLCHALVDLLNKPRPR